MNRVLFFATIAALTACSQYPPPPEARTDNVVETLHGVEFSDPFRWLEDQTSPDTRSFIDAQNAYAERVLGETPLRERLRSRFSGLLRFDEVGPIRKGGDFEYFMLRRASDELAAIYRRPAPPEGEISRIDPGTDLELVLDPHPMSADQTTKIDILSVSQNGRLLLYSVRDGGADEIEIRVRDVDEGVDLPDRLPRALYSSVSFARSGQGFYYTHRSRQDGPRARFHELGSRIENDIELFGRDLGPTSFLEVSEIADGRYLLFTVNHGWARSDLYFQDTEESAPARPIVTGADARFYPQFHEGLLYVRTNLDAPGNRVVAIDLVKPQLANWRRVVPETDDVLTEFAILEGKIYASYLEDVSARIAVHHLDGSPAGDVAIPAHHTAEIRGAAKGKAFLTVSSFTVPLTTYLLDLETGERALWEEREVAFEAFEPGSLVVEQVFYSSKGGTDVPMYLFHREGIELDGENPTLLFGYGGFNAALSPRFDPVAAAWVAEGGVFAMAHLRGGSEYGESWHRAGMLENKQNVFDDFIAAAEYLIEKDYTNPKKLAIRGISNGGLLVASAFTQRPDLYRAVVCGFPDLDMVRFYQFTETNNLPALLEYGDASIPEQFEFLRKYSPYQAVREGTAYPAVMLTSGDLDTRVSPLQARKMTARLQAATSSGRPVILRYHEKAGHAADYGLPISARIEDLAAELAFLLSQLGASGS